MLYISWKQTHRT